MDAAVFAVVAAVLVFGLLLTGVVLMVRDTIRQRGRWGINLSPVACRACGTLLPQVRRPANLRQTLWGGGTCPQCGLEVDKWGEPVSDPPFPAKWSAHLDDRSAESQPADARIKKTSDDVRRGGEIRD